jgi:hypothetical protein
VRTWFAAGRPPGRQPFGGFEDWATIIGGILDVADIPGFLGNLDQARSRGDIESTAIRSFVETWAGAFGDREVRVGALLAHAYGLDLGTGNNQSRAIRFGKLLSTRRDQVFGGWVIRRGSIIDGYQRWRLEKQEVDVVDELDAS